MRVATAIFMTLFAPVALGAQQVQAGGSASANAAVQAGEATSLRATGDAAADARIGRAFERAQAEGLSTAGLESRVRMGTSRGVSAARIAVAVEHRVDALIASRDALAANGSARGTTMIELGADAIESGARASLVAEVAAAFAGESAPRALAVLGALAAEGRIGADVLASVQSAFDAGVADGAGTASAAGSNVGVGAAAATRATTGVGAAAASAGASVTGAGGGVLPR